MLLKKYKGNATESKNISIGGDFFKNEEFRDCSGFEDPTLYIRFLDSWRFYTKPPPLLIEDPKKLKSMEMLKMK